MLCQECGTANPDINNYCGHCGRRLFPKAVREVPMRETVAANQGRVRSTGDALSRLGVADYDYVEVNEQHPSKRLFASRWSRKSYRSRCRFGRGR